MIKNLAPQMAKTLKEKKQWDEPDVPLEDIPNNMSVVTSIPDASIVMGDITSDIITKDLGPKSLGALTFTSHSVAALDSNICSEENSIGCPSNSICSVQTESSNSIYTRCQSGFSQLFSGYNAINH